MNPRRDAALALVGWYLMIPTWGNIKAPLSEWWVYEPFDSASGCKAARDDLVKWTERNEKKGKKALVLHTASGGDLSFDALASQCIATDDPRLK
jgi:hypothetical protein